MAFYMNPAKRFSDSITLTTAPVKTPKNTREALFIHKAYPNGIFQIENSKGAVLYDRCYTFTDISYVNKDDEDKANVLLSLMDFLKGMSTSFKITVSNQYQNMTQFVNDIFTDINRSDYPEVSEGISMWIKEKMENSDLHDLNRVLTLTITVRTRTYDEARSYFLGMDTELERLFSAMRSIIVPMKAEQRLNMIRNFFYQEEKKEYDFNHDALYDVIPVSVDQYRDFMMFNNDTYVSVLFARDFDTALDDGKLIHTISDTSYQSFVTIDYAPVEHSVTRSMLRSAYGNNERAISQEADSKKSNNQAVTGISYSKKKKRAELEGYMDQLDDDSEECIQAGLLVVVTAGSEDELAARIESMQRTAKNVGAYLETYNYVQLKAFNTALPTGVRQVKKMRSFYTSSLVALQPFFAPEVTEPGGIFYGINNTTKNLVFANRKSLTSPQGIIIGPTGAGKTTMVKLLMRFYDVSSGAILVDGHDIRDYNRADLRDAFGMVLQDTWLFKGTIMENIRYGRLDATDEEVIAAAKAAHAHHFIQTLPGGYDMELNEDASNVSQGQKQLLTIARAILADNPILILDEATSSVDTRTEIRIQKALDNLMKGRTSFVIAHRLSTIKNADMILVMKDGDIIEQGTHDELLAKNGFYAELYNSQFEEQG